MTEMAIQQQLTEAGTRDLDPDLLMVEPRDWRWPRTGGRCEARDVSRLPAEQRRPWDPQRLGHPSRSASSSTVRPSATRTAPTSNTDGHGEVADQNVYRLVRQTQRIPDRAVEIEFHESGVEAHCFTFG
jgi:hypothetical protein